MALRHCKAVLLINRAFFVNQIMRFETSKLTTIVGNMVFAGYVEDMNALLPDPLGLLKLFLRIALLLDLIMNLPCFAVNSLKFKSLM